MLVESSLIERAKEWSLQDPNPTTAAFVQNLVKRVVDQDANDHDAKELQDLFPDGGKRIKFGTAGLRSAMKPGPLHMNDLTVVQTAQGIAKYCIAQNHNAPPLRAVVGYDHRSNRSFQLSSLRFALLTALVLAEAGIECLLLDGFVPTPIIPFAVTRIGAVVGVMVTASHNPKQDDGYKIYWKDGCQIRPPVDKEIAASILEHLTPWVDYGKLLESRQKEHPDNVCFGLSHLERTAEMIDAYYDAIRKSGLVTGQVKLLEEEGWKPPKFAYTAMHGVGHDFVMRSTHGVFGFPPAEVVPSQSQPDPDFPTIPFPNPEEKGALDIARAFAEANGCDVVLANDPDADRMGLAEKDRASGEWTVFTGDQIGTMLGHWIWEQIGKDCGKPVAMCTSAVSSKMLAEIARVEGFFCDETLTGFKWIGSRATELSKEGYRSLFCYEESIGFCCGDIIQDKDGVSGMGVLMELIYAVYHRGMNLSQHLQSLYEKYGHFVSKNGYYFIPPNDPTLVLRIMETKIRPGGKYIEAVGPYEIESIRDLGEPPYDSTTQDKLPTLPTSKSSPMVTLRFKNGCVFQLRASGTEPKFKFYSELRGKPGVARDVVQKELEEMISLLTETLLEPKKNGLALPHS